IKKAIDALPEDDYAQLRQWFSEKDWRKWDREIEADSGSGKLDFLVREALDDYEDLRCLREAKQEEKDSPTIGMAEVKKQIGRRSSRSSRFR
ncbi:MAG: hypothetical protein A2Y65_05980, partial [Deltaproteobacteria bacterium RBG_13_52_11]